MKRRWQVVLFLLVTLLASSAAAQAPAGTRPATIYVQPTDDGFQTYIVAAIIKKKGLVRRIHG
jgi:hypothetical protein